MKNTYWIILLLVIGFAMPMLGQADGKDVRISTKLSKNTNIQGITTSTKDYDVKYYRLNLKADPAVRFIQGTVTTYYVPKINGFNAIQFNLKNNMSVDSVKYHGNHVPSYNFSTPVILNIELPAILQQNTLDSISVYYKGQPVNDGFGSFGLGTTSCFPNDKVMWTLSEPYGAKSWWPCKETLDDKADSLDMIITCPIPYKVASNGLLMDSIMNPDATMTYHWKHRYPIPAYLVAFAIADYKTYSDYITIPNSTPIEVLNYLYKCNTLHRDTIKSRIDLTLKFFVEKFGPYPYKNEKYGHAQCGFGGGMEHATMSFMG